VSVVRARPPKVYTVACGFESPIIFHRPAAPGLKSNTMNTFTTLPLLLRPGVGVPLVLAALAVGLSTPLQVQADIQIGQIRRAGDAMNLQFTDTRLAAYPALNHMVQFSPSLGPTAVWTNVSTVMFAPSPSNILGREATFLASDASGFYRVAATNLAVLITPDDLDGDGLPNATETLLGTDPDKFDSDGDGFSDGVEYAYGTNPNLATSFPSLTALPRAQFAEAISSATEGSRPHAVIVTFDKPFFGTLKYGVLTNSTASESVDFEPLPLFVTVAGLSATIPITWIDDAIISPERVLFLEIQTDPTQPYARGGRTRHTVLLGENDAWWSGVLADKYAQRNFKLRLVHVGELTHAAFVAGAGNDGMPLLESDTNAVKSSQSVGVVPVGTFPATVQFDSPTHFQITSPAMPASTGGLFGPGTGLTRTLILESQPAASGPSNGQDILPERVIGLYTERLAIPGQANCTLQQGTVVLIKQFPARPIIIQ